MSFILLLALLTEEKPFVKLYPGTPENVALRHISKKDLLHIQELGCLAYWLKEQKRLNVRLRRAIKPSDFIHFKALSRHNLCLSFGHIKPQLVDDDLKKLKGIRITSLELHSQHNLTPVAISHLAGMHELEELKLTALPGKRLGYVDDTAAKKIAGMKSLKVLRLVNVALTEEGINLLKKKIENFTYYMRKAPQPKK